MFKTQFKPREAHFTPVGTVSRTQQQFKHDSDVNVVLARYLKTGVLEGKDRVATYADVSDVDYRSSFDAVFRAQEAFASLPALVRKHCDNDPQVFLQWMSEDSDLAFKREYGLLAPEEPSLPVEAEASSES